MEKERTLIPLTFRTKTIQLPQSDWLHSGSKMRRSYYTTTATDFTVTFVDRYNGILKIGLTNAETAGLDPRRYVYDIVLTSPQGIKTRVIEGVIEVTPGVV